jgi:SAM-dependent methyltransferase
MPAAMDDRSRATEFWERELTESVHTGWMHFPAVRRHIIEQIGVGYGWPMDWLLHHLQGRTFRRALSIGCGTGTLERDLIRRGICERVDAFDGAVASLAIAREEAVREGMADHLRYFAADFNRPALPRGVYDAVFFHQSLHHVARLERLLREVLFTLKPDGLLYLDEYVGPSRNWWTDERYVRQREIFRDLVPEDARWVKELPFPIVHEDPSEAVQSGAILPRIGVGFETVAQRGYGGNVLSIMCQAVRWDRAPDGLLERLIEAESKVLATGAPHYYTLLLARPKRAPLARLIASLRYIIVPKVRRAGRELRSLFR